MSAVRPRRRCEEQVRAVPMMTPRWPFVLCVLFTWTLVRCEAFTFVSRADLYSQLANRHVLSHAQLQQLHNVPAAGVFRELVAKDCRAAYLNMRRTSGLYVLWPKASPPMVAYCDLSPEGAGWTFLQRNSLQDSMSFGSHNWDQYRNGFGDLTGDHWLGNDLIHHLTKHSPFTVRILLVDGQGNKYHADYSSFRVDSEGNDYSLRLGDYSGTAGDAMTTVNETGTHDNMKFSTTDRDNDRWSKNCAEAYGGGWWFDSCHSALLNTDGAIYWGGLCDKSRGCRASSIMVKPGRKNCSPEPLPGVGEYYPNHYSQP
ncbi:fibrinogen-like protein 1-like protein isoform X1 [Ranitomeya variabilis]|uniref:fibrinogen-like protein 1-like protein isoform X1 n=2 Tax=Ranitomeya variabilis TaxID=490064 RepID=UPI004057691D